MPKRPTRNRELWKFVHSTIERLPPPFPVIVTVKPWHSELVNHEDFIRHFPGRFEITLHEIEAHPEIACDWLGESFCHAYAHVMSWSHNHDQDHWIWNHEETWGVWYSRLYRAWFEDT
jgi:hypothetical protein